MTTDLDIDALRAFVMVTELGGFTAAGERLGRTQSAMSLKIKRLEDTLGCRVFERTSRSLALTRDGEMLLAYARRLLDLNDETVRRFAEPDAQGDLRLGVAEYFVPQHLPGVLRAFARAYPRVRVDVHVGLSTGLSGAAGLGELDLVIGLCNEENGRGRLIATEPLRWVAAAGVDTGDGEPVPLCTLPAGCVFRHRGLEALDRAGRRWRVAYTSASVMGVRAAAEAGLGVAVLNDGAVPAGLRVLGPAEGFPELGTVDIAALAENPRKKALIDPLVGFIHDSLRALETRRAA